MTKVLPPDLLSRKPKTDIVSQTITEYCNEIRQLREALNNAIAAGAILRSDLPADELVTEKQKLAVILLENARQILDRG